MELAPLLVAGPPRHRRLDPLYRERRQVREALQERAPAVAGVVLRAQRHVLDNPVPKLEDQWVVLCHVLRQVEHSLHQVFHRTAAVPWAECAVVRDVTLGDNQFQVALAHGEVEVPLAAMRHIGHCFQAHTEVVPQEPYCTPLLLVPIKGHHQRGRHARGVTVRVVLERFQTSTGVPNQRVLPTVDHVVRRQPFRALLRFRLLGLRLSPSA